MIHQYSSLVKKIAQHLMAKLPPCVQIDDLIQAGMLGLLEASSHYDLKKGASFETYASIRIRGAMLDEIRRGDWIPRSVHRNTRRINEAIRKIENVTNREAKDSEVAAALNVTIEDYHHMVQDAHGVRLYALEEFNLSEDGLYSTSSAHLEPLQGLQREDFRLNLMKGLESLPDRERLVLKLYYDEELNLRQVGEVLGVSESRASQIHAQAILKLHARFKSWIF